MRQATPAGRQGFFQALGVTLYCLLVGLFMWNFGKIAPNDNQSFLMPVAFLTLFSTSVLVCGLLVFYKPYRLFFEGKKKEAAETVLFTSIYLLIVFVVLISGILIFK